MTDHYAVIGNPVSHSKSPLIHALFAEQTAQDMGYVAIEAPLDGFATTIERLRVTGCKGCNVTVPFKFEAFHLATQLSARALAAQAVNILSFEDDKLSGDNTDGIGLVRDIEKNLGITLSGKRVLLMGAGGAAYGAAFALVNAHVVLTIANRTLEKADRLRHHLISALNADPAHNENLEPFDSTAHRLAAALSAETIKSCSYPSLQNMQFDLVINATSSGLHNEMPPLPSGIFAPGALAYDMMYGRDTPFMHFAQEQGVTRVCDGFGMLVEQAAEAFFIWRGVRPDTLPVLQKLRAS